MVRFWSCRPRFVGDFIRESVVDLVWVWFGFVCVGLVEMGMGWDRDWVFFLFFLIDAVLDRLCGITTYIL